MVISMNGARTGRVHMPCMIPRIEGDGSRCAREEGEKLAPPLFHPLVFIIN